MKRYLAAAIVMAGILAAVLSPGAAASCLTSDQLDYIDSLSTKLNTTPSELRTFFEPFCDMDAYYTSNETEIRLDLVRTQVNQSLSEVNGTVEVYIKPYQNNWTTRADRLEQKVDSAMGTSNLTQSISSLISIINISNNAQDMEEQVYQRISDNLAEKYLLKDYFNSIYLPQIQGQQQQQPDYTLATAGGIVLILVIVFIFIKFRGNPLAMGMQPQGQQPQGPSKPTFTAYPRTVNEAMGNRQMPPYNPQPAAEEIHNIEIRDNPERKKKPKRGDTQ